jgi:hypothetical protein
MDLENADSTPRRRLPVAPGAEGAVCVAFLACALWAFLLLVQLGSEFIGPGKGVFSDHAIGLRGGLAFVWLAAAIGATFMGKQSLAVIRDSEGALGGRGEAITAMVLSLGTIVLTILALIAYGLVQWLK